MGGTRGGPIGGLSYIGYNKYWLLLPFNNTMVLLYFLNKERKNGIGLRCSKCLVLPFCFIKWEITAKLPFTFLNKSDQKEACPKHKAVYLYLAMK